MRIHPAFLVVFVGGATLASFPAAAASTVCPDSYEKAQEERAAGHLRSALLHLKSCIDPSCAKFIRDDCARWMDQVESALPTVVFAAQRKGQDLTDVEVSCDGEPLMISLDGKAVPVDPGPHDFSFKAPDMDPMQRQIVIREGERNRMIAVEFSVAETSASTTADANLAAESGRHKTIAHYLPYGLAGLGALGGAGFALFAIQGNSQKGDLERSCSPHCQSSQVDSVKTKYVVADTCLAVGLVSVGVATYLFLTRRSQGASDRDQPLSMGFVPRTSGAGGVVQVATQF